MHRLMSFVLSPLCFHGLTNCFSRKAFVFKKICVATRVYPLCCRIQPSVAPAIVSFSVFSSLQTLFLSLLSCSTPVPLFSVGYTLFRKNTGGMGVNVDEGAEVDAPLAGAGACGTVGRAAAEHCGVNYRSRGSVLRRKRRGWRRHAASDLALRIAD